jgi:signal transduction histidine kinase
VSSSLSIRWRLTLWYGAVLAAILVIVSVAAYTRYRAAAWSAFDAGLLGSLDAVEGALREELREAAQETTAATAPAALPAMELVRRAAQTTLEEYRLSGLLTEIRAGTRAETSLARTGDLSPGDTLFGAADWARLAGANRAALAPVDPGRRAAVRRFQPSPDLPPLTIAIADRTDRVGATLAAIRISLLELGAAGLALALLGGYWLATRALRPIAMLTAQAGRMAEASSASEKHRLQIANPDDELGRLGATFNRLLERLESANDQLKRFIADTAHELKTPVAIVRAEAELTLSSPRTAEAYRESLATIAAESARLSQRVGDLTLLAEGQTLTHPLERRLVDLSELAHEVRRSLRSLAAGRDVRLEIDAAGCVEYRGDEQLLRQTFLNLAENAVKFSPPGSRVGIGVSEAAGRLEVRFADEAPTLSAGDRERVFERFYRTAEARDDGASGSGLGLAIVQWAVALHGGRVRVEPRSPRGNVFVVELPAPATSLADAAAV